MTAPVASLHGLGVLVTRPAHQAGRLCRLLAEQGAVVYRWPALAIADAHDPAVAQAVLARLERYALVIFTSVNAVEKALTLRSAQDWPLSVARAAIGKATAEALAQHKLPAQLVPATGFSSEDLLALPRLQAVAGESVLIVHGEGGRELLGETLRQRGATVEYADVYRRIVPPPPPAALLTSWADGAIQVVIVTSQESLHNLAAMLGEAGRGWLRTTVLLTISARVAELAKRWDIEQPPLIAREAGDEAIVETLLQWYQAQFK